MRQLALSFVVSLCVASPVWAQTRVYTNADLGKPLARSQTPTAEEMQGLVAHQFTLSPDYDGPKAFILPYDPTWPFTYAQRLEPDPWRTPGGWPVYGPWPFYGGYAFNPFGIHSHPYAFGAHDRPESHLRGATEDADDVRRARSARERPHR